MRFDARVGQRVIWDENEPFNRDGNTYPDVRGSNFYWTITSVELCANKHLSPHMICVEPSRPCRRASVDLFSVRMKPFVENVLPEELFEL